MKSKKASNSINLLGDFEDETTVENEGDQGEDNDDEDEEEEEDEEDHLIDANDKNNLNDSISFKSDSSTFSIGKIKILKPKHRRRKKRANCIWLISILFVVFIVLICLLWFRRDNWLNASGETVKQQCGLLKASHVWHRTFPMLLARSSLRLLDVNNDTILDLIVAFGTGLTFDP
jgi:hypothetical protein